MLNLNTYPYYDDYDSAKGFHKILFHPAKPVQARELTQIQSIIQEQIKRHGDHIFKNGTMVIPGHVFYDNKVKFLKLETIYNNVNIETHIADLVGTTIVGDNNGITATVLHYDLTSGTEPPTIYIKYTSASGEIKEFTSGETLTSKEIPGLSFKITPVTSFTGPAAICTIGEGVYYINGYFVQVAKQTVTVSKYTNVVSAVIGLEYVERVITENEDESLYDNAFGFNNYNAPGAHRLKISLILSKKEYNYTAADTAEIKFIDILKIKNGNIEYLKNDTKYAEIEKWLARRTYEESGNYSVLPFSFSAANYRNNDRGTWQPNTPYLMGDIVTNNNITFIALNEGYSGITAPSHTYGIKSDGIIYWTQVPNKRLFANKGTTSITSTNIDDHISADSLMSITTSPGKAYIQGFEVDFNTQTTTVVPKARETRQLNQSQLYAPAGSYVVIKNIVGLPSITNNLTKVNVLDVTGATIGSAVVRSIEYISGTPGTSATYKLFLFNIRMNVGKNFSRDAYSFNSVEFSAVVVPKLIPLSGAGTSSGTTVTGVGTYFDFELKVGDRITTGISSAKVTAITSPTNISVSSNIGASTSTLYKEITDVINLGDYIRKLPTNSIKTLRDSDGNIDMQYVILKSYSFTTVGSTYNITLTNGESFLPSGHIVAVESGAAINSTYSLDTPATTLTINGLTPATNYKAVVLVKRTGSYAKEKTKTLAVGTLTLTDSTAQKYYSKNISLGEADCSRIIKITESGDPTNKSTYVEAGEVDVTGYYKFDNGQREEFYDVGRITTTRAASRPLRIVFEYFIHSDGDYFSIDSYSSIPVSLLQPVKVGSTEYYLPDCLDFRSRISDNGTEFNNATGASVSDPIFSESTMSTSYSYFLPRKDTIGISNSSKITYVTNGKLSDGMPLASVTVKANTLDPSNDVVFSDDQVVNYTMKDIKTLDTRLTNVENQVVLNDLEKATLGISIKDQFGLERDKNGFLIDDFKGFSASDTLNPDFSAALSPADKVSRALATVDYVQMFEPINITSAARLASGYQLTGSIITLPYIEDIFLNQVIASKPELIQAYFSLDFIGKLNVVPSTDNYITHEYSSVIDSVTKLNPKTNINSTTIRVYDIIGHGQSSYTDPVTGKLVIQNKQYGLRPVGVSGSGSDIRHIIWEGFRVGETISSDTVSTSTRTDTQLTNSYTITDNFAAPKLRPRTLVLSASKLKPFSAMNIFLSDTNVNIFFTPCTKVEISGNSQFAGVNGNQVNDNLSLRTTTLDSYDTILKGDVITCSSGSAVVVGDETIYDKITSSNKRILYVTNVKGTLNGEITGSNSLAKATVISVNKGDRVSNSLGNLYGTLTIPAFTFDSGRHKLLVTDATTSDPNAATTFADAAYSSNGTVVTHTTHNSYTEQEITTVNSRTFVFSGGYRDPLAQTFLVDTSFTEGVFLTSAELFFVTGDETGSVEIQIVDTFNGYPTNNIIEGSRVILQGSNIKVSSSTLIPTKFKFDSFVYLEPGKEYALKVLSNSTKFKVWTSVIGQPRIDNPNILITQQPTLGSLFKSQNNSTWTPEQLQDLTFRLNRAKFDTNIIGKVSLVEAPINNIVTLPANPFKTTKGQTKVKVYHPNHGLAAGMIVSYFDSADTRFNSEFSVAAVKNSEYYIINLPSPATETVHIGGDAVKSEKSIKYDAIKVTGVSEGINTGVKLTSRLSNENGKDSIDTDITPNKITDLTTNKYVYTSTNRNTKLVGANSFNLKLELSSRNDAISPAINMESLSVELFGNKINKPAVADIDFDIDGETIVIGSSNVSFSANNVISIPSTTDYTKIKEGAWIKIFDTGGLNNGAQGYISHIDSTANTLTIIGNTLQPQTNRSASIVEYTSFISETSNGGTAESKHITRQLNMVNKCTGFRVLFAANIHTDADIELYYRATLKSNGIQLSDVAWVKHNITYKKSVNEFEFVDYEYDVTDIDMFDQLQVKFVYLSANSAVTPKISLLRVIAHA